MGKTLTSIAWLDIQFNMLDTPTTRNVWVVCPKSKVEEWHEDILNENIEANVVLLNKSTKKNAELILEHKHTDKTIFITGFTMYGLLFKNKHLPQIGDNYLIVDECQKLNGKNANIAKAVISMSQTGILRKIALLSGTLHSTGYHNLANITIILGIYKNIYQFEHKHLIQVERELTSGRHIDPDTPNEERPKAQTFKVLTGYKNIDYLVEQLNNHGVLLTSEGILPQRLKNEYIIPVPKNDEYDILKQHSVLDDYYAPNGGTKFMGLRMLASNFVKNDDYIKTYKPYKRLCLEGALNNNHLLNERILVFYERNQEFEDIKLACANLGRPLGYINGKGQKRKPFYDNENGVIAIQYQSGSEGINGLQIANHTIYYSPTLSGGLFEQSQKRTDRIGQKADVVNYYYMQSEDTIEADIYKNLRKYQSYTEKIFKGGQHG